MGGVIVGIVGRVEDYILCKDNSRVMRLGFIFKGADHVQAAQLIQKEKGLVTVMVVPEMGFSEYDEEKIANALEKRVGKGNLDIIVERGNINNLIYSKSGKFKYVINLTSKEIC